MTKDRPHRPKEETWRTLVMTAIGGAAGAGAAYALTRQWLSPTQVWIAAGIAALTGSMGATIGETLVEALVYSTIAAVLVWFLPKHEWICLMPIPFLLGAAAGYLVCGTARALGLYM